MTLCLWLAGHSQMESILRQIVEGAVLVHLHPRTLIQEEEEESV